jgi:hypothetical protein
MKQLLINLEDTEYDLLCLARGEDESKSWKSFFLDMAQDRIRLTEAALTIIEGDLLVRGNIINEKDDE